MPGTGSSGGAGDGRKGRQRNHLGAAGSSAVAPWLERVFNLYFPAICGWEVKRGH